MREFLVGGAVRDELLGRPVKDRDWVVVGATVQDMLDRGFSQVGADFPVFLHPDSKEEFALARQERKTAPGYHGFETRFDPDVTIEEDLFRRDLTINAMAKDEEGNLIDPFNGQEDLENGVLRHVSEAFAEDPVRVLRVARFAARYNFDVHVDTMQLMRELVNAGELDHLTAERVWAEFEKAMGEEFPSRFFWTLDACGALRKLMPELHRAIIFTGLSLERAIMLETELVDRFMILFSTITRDAVESVCERLKAPTEVKVMSLKFNRFLEAMSQPNIDAEAMMALMKELDMFRHPDQVRKMVAVSILCRTDSTAFSFMRAFRAASKVSFASLSERQREMLRGADIGKAIDGLRLEAIKQHRV